MEMKFVMFNNFKNIGNLKTLINIQKCLFGSFTEAKHSLKALDGRKQETNFTIHATQLSF
jgi:hypothetical protein